MQRREPLIGDPRQCDAVLFGRPLPVLIERLKYFRRLERMWGIVAESFSDPEIRLETVTRRCGISRNQLNLLLRRSVSHTFHSLLIRYRIYKATELMSERNYSVTEIAFQVGFGSVAAFNRNFRALLSMSPSLFRKQVLESRSGGVGISESTIVRFAQSPELSAMPSLKRASDNGRTLGSHVQRKSIRKSGSGFEKRRTTSRATR